jgi:hypothetical protein
MAGQKYDYIINVGWAGKVVSGGAKVINAPGAISRSSNKRNARIKMKNSGISSPELWLNWQDIPDGGFPVVARTTHHSKGRGFWFCKTKNESRLAAESTVKRTKKRIRTKKGNLVWRFRETPTEGASHFLKFIKNTREFRVHVMAPDVNLEGLETEDYLILKLSEKIKAEAGATSNIIKNHDNGWIFSYPKNKEEPVLDKIRGIAKKALATFGLHWGAVDIMLSEDSGEVYVLEINSTPCLTDDQANTIDKYLNGVGIMLGTTKKPKKDKMAVKNKAVVLRALEKIKL